MTRILGTTYSVFCRVMKERIERLRKILGKKKDIEGREHFSLWRVGGGVCQLFGFVFPYNFFLRELKINKSILFNSNTVDL